MNTIQLAYVRSLRVMAIVAVLCTVFMVLMGNDGESMKWEFVPVP